MKSKANGKSSRSTSAKDTKTQRHGQEEYGSEQTSSKAQRQVKNCSSSRARNSSTTKTKNCK